MEKNTQFKVGMGASKGDEARKAGKEAAEEALKDLQAKPDVVLLFATAHYNHLGGFKELLKGVWEVLPKGTLLLGGEVSGFMTKKGVYAKGVTALTLAYPNMNVAYGIGENIKRNPKKAAKKCAAMIKRKLKHTYGNKIVFTFVSPTTTMNIPGIEDFSNIKSKLLADIVLPMTSIAQKVFQKGFGTDQEIVEDFSHYLPDFGLINIATMDGLTLGTNYQFLNKKVVKETVIALAIETDIPFSLDYSSSATELPDKTFKITDITKDGRIVKTINNKPAFKELQRIMNWTEEEELHDDRWLITSFKYPFSYKKNGKTKLRCIGMILGDYLGFLNKVENTNITMAATSRGKMVESVDEVLTIDQPLFGFFSSCVVRQGFLGIKAFDVQEKLKNYFRDKPFLVLYSGGESIKKPNEQLEYLNFAFTSAIFEDNKTHSTII